MTSTLFDLSDRLKDFDRILTEAGGDATPELEAAWQACEADLAHKSDAVAWYWKRLQADIDAVTNALQELAEKRLALENKLVRLKEYIRFSMDHLGRTEFKGPVWTIALQKNGGKRPVTIPADLAIEPWATSGYVRTKLDWNRDALRIALEANSQVIPLGVALGEAGSSVRIR